MSISVAITCCDNLENIFRVLKRKSTTQEYPKWTSFIQVSGESNHFLNPERESHMNVHNVSLPFTRESKSLTEFSDA